MQPTLFVAQQADMVCSDPAAVVRELPNGLELLHGGMMAAQPVTGIDIMKYAECETPEDMLAVNADYKTDFLGDGEWIWRLDSLVNGDYLLRDLKPVKRIRIYAPNCTSGSRLINDINTGNNNETLAAAKVAEVEVYAPKLVPTVLASGSRFRKGTFTLSENVTNIMYFFNAPYLEDFWINDLPKLKQIENGFDGTKLNKASILRLLGQLPAYTSGTHSGTIGIHVDHQHDDEVLEAIANAESKGWTLTIQWNGTPTAQAAVTYGLRKPPIYAKVVELDGERYLDWGHYVTDETGYETFRSVEAAREHYGLPEEPLTETE